MIVNGQRADEMVGDVNLIGAAKSESVKELPVDAKGFIEAVCGRAGFFTIEARDILYRLANDKQVTDIVRLEARYLLLRDSYCVAKANGKPLGQLVASGKQVAKRLRDMGSTIVS